MLTRSYGRPTGRVVLLLAALGVMALTLAGVFRTRLRLAPLFVALTATGITFGLLKVTGSG